MSKEPELTDLLDSLKDHYITDLKREGKEIVTPENFKQVYFPNKRFHYLGEMVQVFITDIKVSKKNRPGMNTFYEFCNYQIIPGEFLVPRYIEETIIPTWQKINLGIYESGLSLYHKTFKTNLIYIDTTKEQPNAYYKPTLKKTVSPETFNTFKDFYDE